MPHPKGWLGFPNGASSSCSEADVANGRTGWSGYTISLSPGQDSVTIKTDPESRWQLTAEYVKQERTPLGVHAKGETYGVESPENGTPDLIAVMATNGQSGYAYALDLFGGPMPTSPEDAVKNFNTPWPRIEIPVFLKDGETQIGVFEAAGSAVISPRSQQRVPPQVRPYQGHRLAYPRYCSGCPVMDPLACLGTVSNIVTSGGPVQASAGTATTGSYR